MPTGFLPIEDQGYLIVVVQLPDGASLERTQQALDEVTTIARKAPGVDKVVAIAGVRALNDSASLANAGVAYVILKDWSERGKGEDLLVALQGPVNAALGTVDGSRAWSSRRRRSRASATSPASP